MHANPYCSSLNSIPLDQSQLQSRMNVIRLPYGGKLNSFPFRKRDRKNRSISPGKNPIPLSPSPQKNLSRCGDKLSPLVSPRETQAQYPELIPNQQYIKRNEVPHRNRALYCKLRSLQFILRYIISFEGFQCQQIKDVIFRTFVPAQPSEEATAPSSVCQPTTGFYCKCQVLLVNLLVLVEQNQSDSYHVDSGDVDRYCL